MAYVLSVLVGMMSAYAIASAALSIDLNVERQLLIEFGEQTLFAAAVALLPTIILYNVAVLRGWTRWPAFCIGGALVPIIGGAFMGLYAADISAILVGMIYSLFFVPSGALAGFVFYKTLGPIHD